MGRLKPIGSEKLTGEDKIKRMLEIARFKEVTPAAVNESARTEFTKKLADGNQYEIVKEKLGYIIKRTLSESESEYIEPMKNRKYYSSYSQALKRMNLLAGEINRLTENTKGTSLFGLTEGDGEMKYVLKPLDEQPTNPAPAAAPPAPAPVPQPELPSPPAGDDMPLPEPESSDVPEPEAEPEEQQDGEEKVTFKTIQKLTGKLTQKIRVLDNDEGMTSEDVKYVLNMVLSALDIAGLSEEDKEDIIMKIEEAGEDMEGEDMGAEEDITSDTEVEDIQSSLDTEIPSDAGEMTEYGRGAIIDSIFGESKVDKVLSKYFDISESEKKQIQEKKKRQLHEAQQRVKQNNKFIENYSKTIEQELASKKFLEENANYKLVGRTNRDNLIFEYKDNQVKVTKYGVVI